MNVKLASLLAALLAFAVLGVAGCGGDDEDGDAATAPPPETTATETAPSEEPVATIAVRESEFELDPATPTVDRPGTVEIEARNVGEVVHALTVETPSGEAETERIQPDGSETLRVELTEPGKYTWYCPVANHRDLGMEGAITVRGAAGGGSGEGGSGDAGAEKQEGDAGEDTGPATQPQREPPPETDRTQPPATREETERSGSGY